MGASQSTSAISSTTAATTCSATLTASYAAPSVASGYKAVLVYQGLKSPRSIKFDSAGNLLVVEAGKGVSVLTASGGDCPGFTSNKTIISDTNLNHGLEFTSNSDATYLYASSTESLFRWSYDPTTQSNTSAPQVLVNNMTGTDHSTRTLLIPNLAPEYIVIGRGSLDNLDASSADFDNAISQVRAFSLAGNSSTPVAYGTGTVLGWGLRNEVGQLFTISRTHANKAKQVGIAQDPVSGAIYGVENSADNLQRDGVDIHQNNPGEKLNYLGAMNGNNITQVSKLNFGYPTCFSAWSPSIIPNFTGTVGQQFAIDFPSGVGTTDAECQANRSAPRLTFQAHMAPLDILFNPEGTVAWITFHGSWNRDSPVGYKLSAVNFANGQPVDASDSTTAARDIMSNANNTVCPGSCFRPVGLAWDSRGRLFMSSDATGEIYAILTTDGTATSGAGSNSSSVPLPSATTSPTSSSSTSSPSATSTTSGSMSSVTSMSTLAIVLSILVWWI